jgi:hypothetical protein
MPTFSAPELNNRAGLRPRFVVRSGPPRRENDSREARASLRSLPHGPRTGILRLEAAGLNAPFPLPELFALGGSPKDQVLFQLCIGPSTSARLGEAPTPTCAPQAA